MVTFTQLTLNLQLIKRESLPFPAYMHFFLPESLTRYLVSYSLFGDQASSLYIPLLLFCASNSQCLEHNSSYDFTAADSYFSHLYHFIRCHFKHFQLIITLSFILTNNRLELLEHFILEDAAMDNTI